MVRLVKGAYWDTEIKRAQVDGLDGYPVYTRKVYTDVSYLACARKLLAAPDAIYPQFATHNAQTLAAIYQLAGPNYYAGQYEFQCLHGMGEPLYEQVVGAGRAASSAGRAASTRRSARTRRCWPTWCGACWRTAPTPRSSTASPIRRSSLDELVADPVAAVERMARDEGALGLPHPRIPLPRALFGAGARQFARASTWPTSDRSRALARGAAAPARSEPWRAAPLLGRAAIAPARRSRCAIPPTRATWSARCVEADAERRRGRAAAPRPRRAALAAHRRRPSAPHASSAPPTRMEAADAALLGLLVREAGKTLRERASPRCARRSTSCATTRRRRARDFGNDTHRPLGPGGLHQPVELPAGDLHRPGRRGAGRRQPGARQAGRADAADRRRGRAPAARGRRAARRAAAAARPRRDRRRRAGRRRARAAAWCSPARPRSRACCSSTLAGRLDRRRPPDAADRRDRRAERDDRRLLGAGRAGGGRRAWPRPSTAPASAARRCACCACRRTSPTACSRCCKGAMAELRVGDPTALRDRRRPGDRRRGAAPASSATSQRCARAGRRVHQHGRCRREARAAAPSCRRR